MCIRDRPDTGPHKKKIDDLEAISMKKYMGNYTNEAAKALKGSERIICRKADANAPPVQARPRSHQGGGAHGPKPKSKTGRFLPVSYTHLDVYKRQSLSCRTRRSVRHNHWATTLLV